MHCRILRTSQVGRPKFPWGKPLARPTPEEGYPCCAGLCVVRAHHDKAPRVSRQLRMGIKSRPPLKDFPGNRRDQNPYTRMGYGDSCPQRAHTNGEQGGIARIHEYEKPLRIRLYLGHLSMLSRWTPRQEFVPNAAEKREVIAGPDHSTRTIVLQRASLYSVGPEASCQQQYGRFSIQSLGHETL